MQRASPFRMDSPALLAALAGLGLAPVIGWASTQAPKLLLMALIGGILVATLLARPRLLVPVLVMGALFDEVYLTTPVAKFGIGDLAIFVIVPVWFVRRMIKPRGMALPPGWAFLLGFLALAFSSMMLGVAPDSAVGYFSRVATYLVGLAAIYDLSRDRRVLEDAILSIAVAGVAHACISLSIGWYRRLSGLANQPNVLGIRLAFGALCVSGLMVRTKKTGLRVVLGACLALLLLCVVLTVSRGTYISLGVAFLWWLRRQRRMALMVIAVAGIVLVALPDNRDTSTEEFVGERLQFADRSVDNRTQVLQNTLLIIQAHPWLGVGFGQFTDLDQAVDITAEKGRSSHIFYLGTAASAGIPALLALLGFAFVTARRMWRRRAAADQAAAAGDVIEVQVAWMLSIFQALFIYHGMSLLTRDASRVSEWLMLGLYAAAGMAARPAAPPRADAPVRPPARPRQGARSEGPEPSPVR